MTTRSTYTLAVRDHQLNNQAHDVVTFDLECAGLAGGGSVDFSALDAALAALRAEVIKSARFHAEIAAQGDEEDCDQCDTCASFGTMTWIESRGYVCSSCR